MAGRGALYQRPFNTGLLTFSFFWNGSPGDIHSGIQSLPTSQVYLELSSSIAFFGGQVATDYCLAIGFS